MAGGFYLWQDTAVFYLQFLMGWWRVCLQLLCPILPPPCFPFTRFRCALSPNIFLYPDLLLAPLSFMDIITPYPPIKVLAPNYLFMSASKRHNSLNCFPFLLLCDCLKFCVSHPFLGMFLDSLAVKSHIFLHTT